VRNVFYGYRVVHLRPNGTKRMFNVNYGLECRPKPKEMSEKYSYLQQHWDFGAGTFTATTAHGH
jgi:hypothetical protein